MRSWLTRWRMLFVTLSAVMCTPSSRSRTWHTRRWQRLPQSSTSKSLGRRTIRQVADVMDRHGRLVLQADPEHGLVLRALDAAVLEEVVRAKAVAPLLGARLAPDLVAVAPAERGRLKQALLKVGWPADDQAGYVDGAVYPVFLDETDGFELRPYQRAAIATFFASGTGVVVLPCGAGKTLVGAGAIATASARTLILVTNTVSARQWRAELLARTSLT